MSIEPAPRTVVPGGRRTRGSRWRDPELWFILAYNVTLIVAYWRGDRNPMIVVWGYYLQSVFIGLQAWTQMLIDRRRGAGDGGEGCGMLFLFPLHFGGFHVVYLVFLLGGAFGGGEGAWGDPDLGTYVALALAWCALDFVIYLLRELHPGLPNHRRATTAAAYARVFPIHLFIILGAGNFGGGGDDSTLQLGWAFVLFMALKTVVDLAAYARLSGLRQNGK